MSVNIYLNEEILKADGFVSLEQGKSVGTLKPQNLNILRDKGRLYVVTTIQDSFPATLEKFVEEVSLYEYISAKHSVRETGIYRHDGAEAELQVYLGDDGTTYSVMIKSKKIKAAFELLRKIKTGSIRPEESYDGVQSCKSATETWTELQQTQAELLLAKAQIADVRNAVTKLIYWESGHYSKIDALTVVGNIVNLWPIT